MTPLRLDLTDYEELGRAKESIPWDEGEHAKP
jgi:hypothetical protein